MEINTITEPAALQAFKEQWDQLWKRSVDPLLHLSYNWFLAGWECFHRNDQLQVIIVSGSDGECLGIAPLVITSTRYHGVKVQKICFPHNEQSPSNDFVFALGREEECLDLILEYLSSFLAWELVDLQKMESKGLSGTFLKRSSAMTGRISGYGANIETPYVPIEGDWKTFWRGRSSRFRKSMRNKLNRAEKSGDLQLEKVAIFNADAPELEEMLSVSSRSWKAKTGTDLLSKQNDWQFYKKICALFGPEDLVDLWLLRKGTYAIAYEFQLNFSEVVYPIRACFDQAYRHLSPGSILEFNIMQSLFCCGTVKEYNTCGHTYGYLLNWTDRTRKYENFEVFKKSVKMSCLYAAKYKLWPTVLPLKRRLLSAAG